MGLIKLPEGGRRDTGGGLRDGNIVILIRMVVVGGGVAGEWERVWVRAYHGRAERLRVIIGTEVIPPAQDFALERGTLLPLVSG